MLKSTGSCFNIEHSAMLQIQPELLRGQHRTLQNLDRIVHGSEARCRRALVERDVLSCVMVWWLSNGLRQLHISPALAARGRNLSGLRSRQLPRRPAVKSVACPAQSRRLGQVCFTLLQSNSQRSDTLCYLTEARVHHHVTEDGSETKGEEVLDPNRK